MEKEVYYADVLCLLKLKLKSFKLEVWVVASGISTPTHTLDRN